MIVPSLTVGYSVKRALTMLTWPYGLIIAAIVFLILLALAIKVAVYLKEQGKVHLKIRVSR